MERTLPWFCSLDPDARSVSSFHDTGNDSGYLAGLSEGQNMTAQVPRTVRYGCKDPVCRLRPFLRCERASTGERKGVARFTSYHRLPSAGTTGADEGESLLYSLLFRFLVFYLSVLRNRCSATLAYENFCVCTGGAAERHVKKTEVALVCVWRGSRSLRQ